jgi:hydroxymethylglutaryl-CoA reductase
MVNEGCVVAGAGRGSKLVRNRSSEGEVECGPRDGMLSGLIAKEGSGE